MIVHENVNKYAKCTDQCIEKFSSIFTNEFKKINVFHFKLFE